MKQLLIAAVAAMATFGAGAELLTPEAALERALGQVPSTATRRAVRAAGYAPLKTVALNSTEAELYVFGAQSGLMIVSAESDAPALLGYSADYRPGQPLPPALEMMLESYAEEIASLRTSPAMPKAAGSRADFDEVAPICQTSWDQSAPYNNMTPIVDGKHTMTGCVATAIAQVLKTYSYPATGSGGLYTYAWEEGGKTLSLNFDDVTFDWDNMLNKYNGTRDPEVNQTAVATLMMACGYAADMSYGLEASGATGNALARGLVRNLGYDPGLQYLERNYFSLADWTAKVYGEVAAGRPVYYDGMSLNSEGHAFVVDGYRSEGFFHLNWGWGGLADGYFLLTALDPTSQGIGGAASGAGFNLLQGAIFGLKPNTDGATQASTPLLFAGNSTFGISTSSITMGSNVSVSFVAYNFGNFAVERVAPALCFTADDGTRYYSKSTAISGTVQPLSGFNYGAVATPANMPAGSYTVTPAVYSDVNQAYYHVYGPLAMGMSVAATVSGTRITFNGTQRPELQATIASIPEIIYPRRSFSVDLTIENSSAAPFTGTLYLGLCASGKTATKAYISTFVANVDGNSSQTLTIDAELLNMALTEGNYDVYVLDTDRSIISSPTPVELVIPDDLGLLTASGLTVDSKTPDDVSVTVTVAASQGSYTGQVWLQLHNRGDYNNYIARFPADIKLKNGGSTKVTLGGAFPQGVPGKYYTAYIYYTREGVETECSGRQRKTFQLEEGAAIDEITANDAPAAYFDLMGRKVAAPRRGQLYITDKGTKTIY